MVTRAVPGSSFALATEWHWMSFRALSQLTGADILTFQETHLPGPDLVAFGHECRKTGSRVWSIAARVGRDSRGRRSVNGGLIIAVKSTRPSLCSATTCGSVVCGSALTTLLLAVWGSTLLRPALRVFLVAVLGDFNATLDENPLQDSGDCVMYVAMENGEPLPTRWSSSRCIGYLALLGQGQSRSFPALTGQRQGTAWLGSP